MMSPGDSALLRSSKKATVNATGEKRTLKAAAKPAAGREENQPPKDWVARNRVALALLGAWTCLAAVLFASHVTATAAGFGAVWLLGACSAAVAIAMRDAQARKRATLASNFRQLFDEAPIAQHELDDKGIILRVNREYCAMLGYDERELVGRPIWDFVSGSDATDGLHALTAKLTGEQPLRPFLRRYLRKDGSEIMLEIRDSRVRDSRGAVSGVTTSLVDVTERYRAQEALRESEETSRSVGDAVLDALIMMDAEGRVTRWNPAAERMFGYAKAEMMGQPLHDRLAPAGYRPGFQANFPKFRETGTGPAIGKVRELRGIRKDGSEFPLELSLTGVQLHGQWQAVGVIQDITERKRADDALAAEVNRRRTIFEHSRDGIVLFDRNGKVLESNQSFADMLGYSPQEMLQLHVWDWDAQLTQDQILVIMRDLASLPPTFQSRHKRKDGSLYDAEISCVSLDAGGDVVYYALTRDITERKALEAALAGQLSLLENLIEGVPDSIYIKDRDSRFVRANRALANRVGVSDPRELIGKSDADFFAAEHAGPALADEKDLIEGRKAAVSKEEKETWPDGREAWVQTTKLPLRDHAGAIIGTLGISRDITERKRGEEALRESDAKFRELFDGAPVPYHELDMDGNVLRVNRAECALLGYEAGEMLGRPVWEFIAGGKPEARREAIRQKLSGKQPLMVTQRRFDRRGGGEVWVELHDILVRNPMGEITGIRTAMLDITARKLTEEALAEEVIARRTVFEQSKDGIVIMDQNGKAVESNQSFADMLGYSPEEMLSLRVWDWDAQLTHERILEIMRDPASVPPVFETRHKRKDGSLLDVEISCVRVESGGGARLYNVVRDVTARKRAESYRHLRTEVLRILAEPGDLRDSIRRVLTAVKAWVGFDAVGIRLKDGDDFPYLAQEGFPKDFLLTENTLIERGADGGACRDKDGNVSLECTCGLVISGKTDPSNPLFTKGGSFATNDSFPLLDLPPDQDPRRNPHNQCMRHGYASVALAPIRTGDRIVGLLQFNDRRKGCLTPIMIEQMEGIAAQIGEALLRKRAEEDLRESDAKFRDLFDGAPVAYHELDREGVVLRVNRAECALLGYEAGEMVGRPVWDLIAGGTPQVSRSREAIRQRLSGEQPLVTVQRRFARRGGGEVWVELHDVLVRNAMGEITGIRTAMLDISERKRAEEGLLRRTEELTGLNAELEREAARRGKAEEELRAREFILSESQRIAHIGSWNWDLATGILTWTPELYRLHGVSPDTFVPSRETLLSSIHPGDRAAMQTWLDACEAGGEPADLEFRVSLPGGVRNIFTRGHLVRDAENKPVRMVGTAQDISEPKRAEEALRESEETFRAVSDGMLNALFVMDDTGRIILSNPAAERMFGYKEAEAVGQFVYDRLAPGELRTKFQANLPLLRETGTGAATGKVTEVRGLRKDGSEFPMELSLSSIRIRDRWQAVGIIQDIGERRRAEDEVRRANEKLSASIQKLLTKGAQEGVLSEMRTFLQACSSTQEIGPIVAHSMRALFPGSDGALFLLSPSRADLETAASWGDFPEGQEENAFSPDACWGLRRGCLHVVDDLKSGLVCPHMLNQPVTAYACLPLTAKSDVIGLLNLRSRAGAQPEEARETMAALEDISSMLSEMLSLSISNLKLSETLRVQSIRDPLTGLFNRRYMEECLQREIWRASRNGRPIGIIMADIDHFKNFNDKYGHGAGDHVLSAFGKLVNAQIRGSDIACRFGGEEFIIILPEATPEDAPWRANELREAVKALHFTYDGLALGPVTISMGVATYPEGGTTSEELLKAADAALYKAKLAGRDRVVVHGQTGLLLGPQSPARAGSSPAHTLKDAA